MLKKLIHILTCIVNEFFDCNVTFGLYLEILILILILIHSKTNNGQTCKVKEETNNTISNPSGGYAI